MKKATSRTAETKEDIVNQLFTNPETKERAREEFLASVNHDLRTPLNAVIGFAQLIENEMYGKVHPQYVEYAKHIQESGYDLLSKIEDMLDPPSPCGTLERKTAQPAPRKKLAIAE